MPNSVIIALDFPTKEQTIKFLNNFENENNKPYVKIGMELYYKEGIEFVKYLKEKGFKIFLDLKLFDIPNTVYKSIYNIVSNVEIDIINVHALGGKTMLTKAKQAIVDANVKTKLIAVTLLTSMGYEQIHEDFGIKTDFYELWHNLVELTKKSTLDGIVCSALDLEQIQNIDKNFIFITPGVRFNDDNIDDQERVVTPRLANYLGSTFIVVGRPITKNKNPLKKYNEFMNEFLTPDMKKDFL